MRGINVLWINYVKESMFNELIMLKEIFVKRLLNSLLCKGLHLLFDDVSTLHTMARCPFLTIWNHVALKLNLELWKDTTYKLYNRKQLCLDSKTKESYIFSLIIECKIQKYYINYQMHTYYISMNCISLLEEPCSLM